MKNTLTMEATALETRLLQRPTEDVAVENFEKGKARGLRRLELFEAEKREQLKKLKG